MLFILRRFLCKYVRSYHTSMKRYSKSFTDLPSALYIGLEHKSTVFSALDPYLDIDGTFCDLEKLKLDIENRNMKVDVDFLYQQSIVYKRIVNFIKITNESIDKMNANLKRVIHKNDPDLKNEELDLKSKIGEAKNKLKTAKQEYLHLEKTFIIPFLDLPNSLHKNTTTEEEVLFSLFPRPEFSFAPKSHVEVATTQDELDLKDVSPTSFYLKKKLAMLELAVSDFILSRFQENDFTHTLNMDTVKAFVAEGCGIRVKGELEPLRIKDEKCLAFNQFSFLFGGSSLPSFVALFCKGLISFVNESPIRLITIGRKYDHRNAYIERKEKDLFTSIQSTCVSAFVVYPRELVDEAVVNEIAMLITQIYTELGLHFKLLQYGAPNLRPEESLAVGICMYSPYLKRDIEVGRISLCHDFISKRLQIIQSVGKKKGTFPGMLYVEILDICKWIGCMLENTQSQERGYVIPECVEPFML